MSDAPSRNSEDLMQALESLRHLLEKDETDISQAVDLDAIPTLNSSVDLEPNPSKASAGIDPDNETAKPIHEVAASEAPKEVQLSFDELNDDSSADIDKEFQILWKILKPKLKKVMRESFEEFKAKQKL